MKLTAYSANHSLFGKSSLILEVDNSSRLLQGNVEEGKVFLKQRFRDFAFQIFGRESTDKIVFED